MDKKDLTKIQKYGTLSLGGFSMKLKRLLKNVSDGQIMRLSHFDGELNYTYIGHKGNCPEKSLNKKVINIQSNRHCGLDIEVLK